MAREMREVWVELDQHGCIRRARSGDEPPFAMSTVHPRHEVKRLPLLTPHDAAVLEAAEAFHDVTVSPRLATLGEYIGARETMSNAVRELRRVREKS